MKQYSEYLSATGEYGTVKQLNPPLITLTGLDNVHLDEVVISEDNEKGVVFNILKDEIDVLMFSSEEVKVGTQFTRSKTFVAMPVGEDYLGSVITSLGEPYLGKVSYKQPKEYRYIHSDIKGIAERRRITKQFLTGVTMVDLTIPLGQGQKELILGDRKSGKTSFILNILKKSADEGMIVIYALIGKNKQDIKKLYEYCVKEKIHDKMVVIASSSSSSPSLVYITPYSAMTMAEYFRDQGKNVIIVLDDLSAHAKFHREISLVANNFPGRESYPGDIFYNHAKLIERSGNFQNGKTDVSITCLPVVETVEGDLSGYIPTNVMGMTDGHIFFDSNAFYNGQRPAINISLSVTRVGKQTQSDLQREINRELTAFLAEYEKMRNYSHFGAELSLKVQKILQKGDQFYTLFQQNYNETLPLDIQIMMFGLIWSPYLDTNQQVIQLKNYFASHYSDKKVKEVITNVISANTVYDLLKNVAIHKDKIMSLLQT